MHILISNDDGIFAAGVLCLANTLAGAGHDITVVCPDRERSATGHALTLHKPLRADPVTAGFDPSVKAWACSGTPSDCVKLGLDGLMDHSPDWVLSGINQGSNLGTDVLYSGTVSAAMEGLLERIPSMAISLASFTVQDFQPAADTVVNFLEKLAQHPLPRLTLLNVNVPAVPATEIRGMMMAPLGIRKYTDIYEKRVDPRGKTYYWLAGEVVADESDPYTDVRAVQDHYVSVTPLQPNLTDHQAFLSLQDWGLNTYQPF
jgi:5'-nucleotidase